MPHVSPAHLATRPRQALTGTPEDPPAPPRPRASRLLGFALELQRNQLRTYERAMRRYGDTMGDAPAPAHLG